MRFLFAILFVTAVLFYSCDDNIQVNTRLTSFKELQKHFDEVPNTYKTVPFWVWNGRITREMIDKQLSDYASKDFGGVFIHPRYGLITEYASEEWYELVAYAVKKGKQLDMDIWLYDENSFPSGFAGGLVPAEMPSSYNEGHALKMHRQNTLQPDSASEYMFIYKSLSDGLEDITSDADDYIGQKGDFILFEKIYYPVRDWYAGYSYVDLIKPGVTEKFIEVTMTGYEDKMKIDFGDRVPGVFTDEPNIAPQGDKTLIRWTPDLFQTFEERWGYRLEPELVSLVEDSNDSREVRHNYYQLLLELFIERWAMPWYNYTQENNLFWTGHYWEHGWPSPHHGPDNMAMYAWHQIPGIDMLFNTRSARPDQFGNVRAVRELNSVANQLGMVRKLSETYGGSGWELTFEDMKRNGDWEYALGVNLMNQHLSYQTLLGDRKHDFPQSFSYHVPYWDELAVLNRYYGRLSLALSSGEQINRALVLEPTTSAWMYYTPGAENRHLDEINNEFSTLLSLMENEKIEYDLASENIMAEHGSINEELFRVGDREYNYLVIPRFTSNINGPTVDLIEEYLENGGVIIALCEAPAYVDGQETDRCKQWPGQFQEQWLTLSGCNDPRLINYLRTEDFIINEQIGDSLFHMRRRLDDGQLLFFVNSGITGTSSIRLSMRGKDVVEMDLFDGKIHRYPAVLTDNILSFKIELKPAESILLFIGQKEVRHVNRKLEKWNQEGIKVSTTNDTIIAEAANALNLDYCRLILGQDTSDVQYFYNAQTKIFNHYGFEKNPWVSASQFKTEIVDRDTFTQGSGFKAIFPFFIDSDFRTRDLRVVVERPDLYNVTLNGQPVNRIEDNWWLDENFGVFRIRDGIKPGHNEIAIEANPMSVYCELEPVYLVGDFDVLPLDKGWILATSTPRSYGSWKKQGMPFYSDAMNYQRSFNLVSKAPVKVILHDWRGTVATVSVNGVKAGQIIGPPYELRLDEYVKKGENHVTVTVYGSLKNLLGPHHNVKRRGIVTPWSFKYAPEIQPSGSNYDMLDYGLMEPFELKTLKAN